MRRYRYLRATQGSHAAGDGYTKGYDVITAEVTRKSKCIDDTLLWDRSIQESFWHIIDYIDLWASNGVVFNPKKFKFSRPEIEFAEFNVTPSSSTLEAIGT